MKKSFIFLHPPVTLRKLSEELNKAKGNVSEYPLVPMGLFSMASRLEEEGFETKIVNVSLLKLLNPEKKVEELIEGLDATIFGVDLHWFTHSYGAIELAKLLKFLKNDSKVVIGGYTSSFFYEEIMKKFKFIDGIALGLAEESIVKYAKYVHKEINVNEVPSFAIREGDKTIVNYGKYESENKINEYNFVRVEKMDNWREYLKCGPAGYDSSRKPSFWVLLGRGCMRNCGYCGGGIEGFKAARMGNLLHLREAEKISEDIDILSSKYGVKLINFSHDPEAFGEKYYKKLFENIRGKKQDIVAYWDSFGIPKKEFVDEALKTFSNIIVGISLESTLDEVRFKVGRKYTIEEFIKARDYLNDKRIGIDIYWTIGLPGETEESALKIISKSSDLMRLYKNAVVIPPFPYTLDPNAPMALNPEQYGIKKLYKNFEDYYKATSSLKWIDWVAHETKNMSKKKIAEVTEKIYRAINEIYEAGLFRENVEHRYRLDHEL
ncbi:MAG: radical SAM protein [Thermoproteota archaeon]|nr:radical SAM protein [Candidatus Brockarchaeota archaeon]